MSEKINVLLVDDDADDHLFFKEAIKKIKNIEVDVTSVFNGSQVLEFLFRTGPYSHVTDPLPDVIILDVNMPVISGESVLRSLKSIPEFNDIPVYMLTTSRNEELFKKCMVLGAANCFTKPILLDQLTSIIQKIIVGRLEAH
jgi:two-component system response regulator